MHRRSSIFICGAVLIPIVFAILTLPGLAASSDLLPGIAGGDHAQSKIDAALAKQLESRDDGQIPVIVMLQEEGGPEPEDLDVKYRYHLIPGLAGEASPLAIRKMAESEGVQGIYLDASARISAPANSTSRSDQGDLLSPARIINADSLWEKGIDGRGVTVAVIDSGIDRNHPDLVGKVIGEKNFVADESSADDFLGHGTMVAGIIAGSGAASNGKYKGVAPGASLLGVKVIDSKGDGKVSDIIAGIEWALYNGADVLSLSLGDINLGETNLPVTVAADNAADAGAVVCVMAGNRNGAELEEVLMLRIPIVLALPPGLIDSPGDGVKVITLGATDGSGHVAGFSGSGPTRDDRVKPDLVAPGVDVVSTAPPGLEKPEYIDVYYARESGTSLSTPAAAGLAALLLQKDRNLTPAGVKAALTRGAMKLHNTLGEEYEEYYQGAGLLDAPGSYEILGQLGQDLCGAIPDRWMAGRWAYLPAGKGVYAGLDTGADRPQKKLYSLAPGDEDWNMRFVFFSNVEIRDINTSATGKIANWIRLQPLPRHLAANDQVVFAASIAVPKNAAPGIHNGSIEIAEGDKRILSIPVSVTVAEPFNITRGRGLKTGTLKGNDWDYYYLDIPAGTSGLQVDLRWKQNSDLDLFLLSPTSEYYAGEQSGLRERKVVKSPPSGRWLLAVHSKKNISERLNYSLQVERSLIETFPSRWNLESAYPGTNAKIQFVVENRGNLLQNISYASVKENVISQDLEGSVRNKETWNHTITVAQNTSMISARLSTFGGNNQSEVALVFEDPEGIAGKENAVLGFGDLGPLRIFKPEPGNWQVKVYGNDVPEAGQSFKVMLKEYAEDPWTWIAIRGPKRIESDSSETVEADLTIPKNTSLPRLDGFIKISSANQSFQIPVSVVVAGTALQGLVASAVADDNRDGYFDRLDLEFGVNITAPGDYRLEGVLADCSGHRIDLLRKDARLQHSGSINISVNGSEIWRKGECGPLAVANLLLYDGAGNLVDRYEKSIAVEREPEQFQPPSAYLTGGFVNLTTTDKVGIAVNVSAIRPGRYQISGKIEDDDGEELDEDSMESTLATGNATLLLEFNPTRFMMLGRVSRVHLVDLVLSGESGVLERRDDAWSSGEMDPAGFGRGIRAGSAGSGPGNEASSQNNSRPASMQRQNGTVVIN